MKKVIVVVPVRFFRVLKTLCVFIAMLGVATAAGAEALPKPPGALKIIYPRVFSKDFIQKIGG
jgi:hypothetical protein